MSAKQNNFYYITKHGLGPGTIPKDLEVFDIQELDAELTSFYTNRRLTDEELVMYNIYKEYDLMED